MGAGKTVLARVRLVLVAMVMSGAGALTPALALAQQPDRPQQQQTEAQAQAAAQPSVQAPGSTPDLVDKRFQYPAFLTNSYFGVHLAYINYNFSEAQLEPGFRNGTLSVPRLAARVDLLGHRFNEHVAIQGTYMRPVAYVTYRDINGDRSANHVWMNFGAIEVLGQRRVTERLSGYVEVGGGVVSRKGFERDGVPVIRNAHYASTFFGAGVIYHASPEWDLVAGATYIPSRASEKQPAVAFVTGGFRRNLLPIPAERLADNERAGYFFPEHVIQLEYLTGHGAGVNKFFSSKVPIFWGGNVEIERGVSVHYDRNVFHTKKRFALDLGTSMSFWRSRALEEKFVTFSVYPLLRFTVLRTEPADYYVMYSYAGPTYISKRIIDGLATGGNFTFQDFMGAGAFIGKDRNVSVALKISHYSNGNLFVDNSALKIPLTLSIGYVF